MAGKSSEDYWNTSSSASFNFDDDTVSRVNNNMKCIIKHFTVIL